MEGLSVIDGGKEPDFKKGSEEWAQHVRAKARKIARDIDVGYLELAKILWEIFDTPVDGNPRNKPIYTQWGYKTFLEYADNELGIRGRKAEHLKRIWFRLRVDPEASEKGGLGLSKETEERLIRVGWSKVRELISILTPENADGWIETAEKVSYPVLLAQITKAREQILAAAKRAEEMGEDPGKAKNDAKNNVSPDQNEKSVSRTFVFYDGAEENVEHAVEQARKIAKAKTGKPNEGYLLDLICTDFLATNTFDQADKDARIAMLHNIQNLFGLKLVVIDPEAPVDKKILYGFQHLEELSKTTPED